MFLRTYIRITTGGEAMTRIHTIQDLAILMDRSEDPSLLLDALFGARHELPRGKPERLGHIAHGVDGDLTLPG